MINKYLDGILDEYRDKLENLRNIKDNFEVNLLGLLKKIGRSTGQPYIAQAIVNGRIKTEESLAAKVAGPTKYTKLQGITDVIGFRIILLFEDDVDSVIDIIKANYSVQENYTIDKRNMTDIIDGKSCPRIGYRSFHFVISYESEPIEIQIRTMLQHTWAEIEHDIGYKVNTGMGLALPFKRKFLCLAGMLEVADCEFLSIKKNVVGLQVKVDDLRDTDSVTGWTLKCVVEENQWSGDLKEIQDYITTQSSRIKFIKVPEGSRRFDHFASILIDADIDQLGKLKEKITLYKGDILTLLHEFCFSHYSPEKLRLIKHFYLEYIAYVTIYREKGSSQLLAVLEKNQIGYDRPNLVRTIEHILAKSTPDTIKS